MHEKIVRKFREGGGKWAQKNPRQGGKNVSKALKMCQKWGSAAPWAASAAIWWFLCWMGRYGWPWNEDAKFAVTGWKIGGFGGPWRGVNDVRLAQISKIRAILGVLKNIARKSSWAKEKLKMVFYQREIRVLKQSLIYICNSGVGDENSQFLETFRGLHFAFDGTNCEFASVKFTNTPKIGFNKFKQSL